MKLKFWKREKPPETPDEASSRSTAVICCAVVVLILLSGCVLEKGTVQSKKHIGSREFVQTPTQNKAYSYTHKVKIPEQWIVCYASETFNNCVIVDKTVYVGCKIGDMFFLSPPYCI